MLGERLGQDTGQVTGTRVLPSDGPGPKIEVTFEANGRLLDKDVSEVGTYTATARPDGTLIGEGQGCVTTSDGEIATWTGTGVGRMRGRGNAASYRGAIYYQTQAESLARLNGIACVYEYDTDESGKSESTVYEWK